MSAGPDWPDRLFEAHFNQEDDERLTAYLAHSEGIVVPLDLRRWHATASEADWSVLRRARPPVLDVGCGPGRHIAELSAQGVDAAGIDASPAAVKRARRRGAPVIHGSVFDPVPRDGEWMSVLLLDGNIGIGGDPVRLLSRCRHLAASGARIFVETEPPGHEGRRGTFRVNAAAPEAATGHRPLSNWFPWATVSAGQMPGLAGRSDLLVADSWCSAGRWFFELGADPGCDR